MSIESDFEDTVKICEFYADPCETFEVDSENCIVFMGGREISPVRVNGHLDHYLVIEHDGASYMVGDLDEYFLRVLPGWEPRL